MQIEKAAAERSASLRALYTEACKSEDEDSDIPFDLGMTVRGKQSAIDTVMGSHVPTSPARENPINNYRCKCSIPARRVPPTGFIEKAGKKPWAAFSCGKGKDAPGACDYWEWAK